MADYFGKDVPKLGFGLMRLPRRGVRIDVEQVKDMVDSFLAAGFTYFDTAYVYPGSEAAVKKALVDRHPRESFTLATKLNASAAATEKSAKKQFETSLKRTGAGYFDYYLLHALMDGNYKKYEKFHLWQFVREQKEKGLIRHVGFSFHGAPALLERLLTEHPEAEFVQLQINYADWEDETVAARANYEIARAHGKGVVIMEPVKGGRLAYPIPEVQKLFKDHAPEASCASWAIRFAASLDGVVTVLSGMSDRAQMADNLATMTGFRPLDGAERDVIRRAQELLGSSTAIACTSCHYCTGGCPKQIPIPEIFAAVNLHLTGATLAKAQESYLAAAPEGRRASDCIGCHQCERACPQHLPVVKLLSDWAGTLEK